MQKRQREQTGGCNKTTTIAFRDFSLQGNTRLRLQGDIEIDGSCVITQNHTKVLSSPMGRKIFVLSILALTADRLHNTPNGVPDLIRTVSATRPSPPSSRDSPRHLERKRAPQRPTNTRHNETMALCSELMCLCYSISKLS